MNRPPAIGMLIIVLVFVSGYVSSSPKEVARPKAVAQSTTPAASTERHPDAHVSYYEEHLTAMGIKRRDPLK